MSPPRFLAITAGVALMAAATGALAAAGQKPMSDASSRGRNDRELLDRYCVTCHNEKLKTGGLALDTLDPANVGAAAPTWEKVVRKLRAGVMPPAGRPRPEKDAYRNFVTRLETGLDRAAAIKPEPGRTETFHRLNRTEYQNVVRDLLGVEVDVASLLPADDASYGFDNIAAALKVSPTLTERYLSAARKISQLAIGAAHASPSVATYRVPPDLSQERHIDGLPLGTRGGTLVRHTFPQDGEYLIQARLALDTQDNIPRYDEPHQLEITLDGERLQLFTLAGEPDAEDQPKQRIDDFTRAGTRRYLDAHWQLRVPIAAGRHAIGVTFLEKAAVILEATRINPFRPLRLALKEPFQRPYIGGFFNEETRSGPYLGSVTISGPFNATGVEDSPSRRKIFVCVPPGDAGEARPAAAAIGSNPGEVRCAKEILTALARHGYRRPVTDADVNDLLAFYDEGRRQGGFESGIEVALRRLLMKPEFLFRIEREPSGVSPGTAYRISDLELASRLSFFLWSSSPDEELLERASRGRLRRPEVLERQVRRLLADPRSQAFVVNFTGQWLYLRNLPALRPDLRLFPDFDESLRQAFREEVQLFFDSLLREDRSALELLTADYTFVNERLARHYGIPNVRGSHFRRVTLADDYRRGLLGKGSILATTSYPHRTSPVLRGKWILENLLGTPPPPPPANVPDLKETNAQGKVLSMRDRMVQHRANPVCASCHAMMDPPGLSLENFDAVGRWRARGESFAPIDASGVLPDGTTFEGVAGLRQALLDRSELFVTTLTEKLLVYALGRGLEYYDAPAVRTIVRDAARLQYRFSALLMGIVQSTPFQMRRSAGGSERAAAN